MKKLLLYIIFAATATLSLAQGVATIKGRILSGADSTALFATVMVNHGSINTMCRPDGSFTLVNVPRKSHVLEIVYLGFKPIATNIEVNASTLDLGTVYMVENSNEIDEVVVTAPSPMSMIKGDTVQFNAASFKTNPDADADELLIKMPGVVIQDGKVEAQGEPVRKIYVDGKLFFGSDPMAALKNLPADAIESIQLFDEPSEASRFTGVDDGETTKAINIVTKTKSNKSDILRMEASGGMGIDSPRAFRYLGGGNYSHFSQRHRITITALSNNVNTARFGQSDLSTSSDVDSNGNPVNASGGVQRVNGLGTNYTFESKKVKLAANYFFDSNNRYTERSSLSNYFPNAPKFDSKSVEGISMQDVDRSTHKAEVRLEWRPTESDVIVFMPRINISATSTEQNSSGLTIQDGDSLNRNRTYTPGEASNLVLSGYALWTHRFNKKGRSLTTSFQYSLNQSATERYTIDSMRQNYKLPNSSSPNKEWINSTLSNKFYNQDISSNTMRLKMTYSEPLAPRHRVLLNLIASRDWGENDKQSKRYDQTTGDYTKDDPNQTNSFTRDYNSLGAGLGYAYYSKKFIVNATGDYQKLFQSREMFLPIASLSKYTFTDFQPNVVFKYMLEKRRYLKFQYQGRTILPRVEQMQNVIDDSSPNSLKVGNPDLKQGYRHSLELFYNATNIERSTNLTVTLRAEKTSNFVATKTEFTPTDRDTIIYISKEDKSGYVPLRGASISRSVNLNGYYAMRFSTAYSIALKAIRSNLNTSISYNYIRTPSLYGSLNYAGINSGGVRIGLTSNISQNVDFNIYSNTTFNYTSNTSRESSLFITQNLYGSVNIILPHGFVFNTLATWKYYKSSNLDNYSDSYYLLNVGIGKKLFKRSNGEFRITAYDLLNESRNIIHSVNSTNINDSYTNTLGRYIMARFTYRFNSLVHSRKPKNDIPDGSNFQNVNLKELKKISK